MTLDRRRRGLFFTPRVSKTSLWFGCHIVTPQLIVTFMAKDCHILGNGNGLLKERMRDHGPGAMKTRTRQECLFLAMLPVLCQSLMMLMCIPRVPVGQV